MLDQDVFSRRVVFVIVVVELQEVHAVFSFAFGAAIFQREPFATLPIT